MDLSNQYEIVLIEFISKLSIIICRFFLYSELLNVVIREVTVIIYLLKCISVEKKSRKKPLTNIQGESLFDDDNCQLGSMGKPPNGVHF